MKQRSLLLSTALCAALVFTSCSKDNNSDTPAPGENKEFTVNAPGFDRWVYFSFAKGDTIATDGSYDALKNSKEWDFAFHRGDIRTNSGPSGPGMGGAFETTSFDLTTVTEKPADVTYTADAAAAITFPTMMDAVQQSRNEVLASWYSMSSGLPPVFTCKKQIFFVRAATGKYAKVQFLDYTNDKGKGGYARFVYQYPVQ